MPKLLDLDQFENSTLDWLFNDQVAWCATFKGSGTDPKWAQRFIGILRTKVDAEKKSRSSERVDALTLLEAYLGADECIMPWADLNTIAVQVALRVREPKLIFQVTSGTCGPNMILVNCAKRTPKQYVTFVMNLVTTGTGRLNKFDLRMPGPVISGSKECEVHQMQEADYAVLGSIGRPKELGGGFWMPLVGGIDHFYKGYTYENLKELLTQLGYSPITMYIVTKPLWEDKVEYSICLNALHQAALSANQFVILATSETFAGYFKDPYVQDHLKIGTSSTSPHTPRKAGSGVLQVAPKTDFKSTTHYVLLHEFTFDQQRDEVTLKFYTWSFSMRRTISLDAFSYYLRGYLVGTL